MIKSSVRLINLRTSSSNPQGLHPEVDKIQTAVTNKNSQIKKIATNNEKT
jgi:hypothetical protein